MIRTIRFELELFHFFRLNWLLGVRAILDRDGFRKSIVNR